MKAEDRISFLKNVVPFSSLDDNDIGIIAETMVLNRFPPKADIIRQGDEGTHFYVVVSGLANVALHDKEEREKIIGFLGEGDCFDETALLTQGVRPAAIQAVEETACMVQDKEQFLLVTQKHPAFLSFFNQ